MRGFEFPTEDGRAHFAVVPRARTSAGMLKLSTRRGKQFNSMVYGQTDKLTGADRKAVLIAEPDAHERGLADGDACSCGASGSRPMPRWRP